MASTTKMRMRPDGRGIFCAKQVNEEADNLLTFAASRVSVPPGVRPFLTIGFLGGFTTFSSFSYETISLLEQERWLAALLNLFTNTGLGLLSAFLGIVVARWLQRVG